MKWKSDMLTSEKPSDSHGTITAVWSNFMEITKHSTLLWKWLNKNNPWSHLFRICLHVRSLWSFNFFSVYFCFVLTIYTKNPPKNNYIECVLAIALIQQLHIKHSNLMAFNKIRGLMLSEFLFNMQMGCHWLGINCCYYAFKVQKNVFFNNKMHLKT